MNAGDDLPGGVGFELRHIRVGQQRQIGMCLQRRIDAHDLRIGLAVQQAGKAVERIAADADAGRRGLAVLLIQQNAERQMKRVQTVLHQAVVQRLDARLVRNRRIGKRPAGRRLVRVFAALAVNVKQPFGLGIIGLERLVFERPRRAKCRPCGGPRRNRARACETAPRHRPWNCRRHNNAGRDESSGRPCRTRFPSPDRRRPRIPFANPSSRASAADNRRARSAGCVFRSARADAPARRRRGRCRSR